jgi:PhnB protein
MPLTPYLFFDGRCEEAIQFYTTALGAEVNMLMRFKDAPDQSQCAPGTEEKIMHASITIAGTPVMLSDGRAQNRPKFEGFALSIDAKDEADGERIFTALAEGGQIQMPLAETFFAKRFGMVADRFGVGWMLIAGSNKS